MKTFVQFISQEEMGASALPANAAGRGDVAGITGEPPVSKKKQKEYKDKNMHMAGGMVRKIKSL